MSGNDEKPTPYTRIGGYVQDRGLSRNRAIAIVLVVMIGSTLLSAYSSLLPTDGSPAAVIPIDVPTPASHVNITGVFDTVDVYSYWEDAGGGKGYKLHAHATENGTYEISWPIQDSSDHDNNHLHFVRLAICITYNGTYTEYLIRIAEKEVYNITFGMVNLKFLVVI